MTEVYAIDGVIPVVDPSAFVHPTAVLIGDVIVGPDCYIGPSASLRGDFGQIIVGRGSNIQDNCTVHSFSSGIVETGELCNVGHGAILHGCRLEDRVLVGMNAVIMDDAVVRHDALVAALAFVPAAKEIPAGVVAAGCPARVVRDLDESEKQWKADGNRDYLNLVVRSRQGLVATEALTEVASMSPRLLNDGVKPLYLSRSKS